MIAEVKETRGNNKQKKIGGKKVLLPLIRKTRQRNYLLTFYPDPQPPYPPIQGYVLSKVFQILSNHLSQILCRPTSRLYLYSNPPQPTSHISALGHLDISSSHAQTSQSHFLHLAHTKTLSHLMPNIFVLNPISPSNANLEVIS